MVKIHVRCRNCQLSQCMYQWPRDLATRLAADCFMRDVILSRSGCMVKHLLRMLEHGSRPDLRHESSDMQDIRAAVASATRKRRRLCRRLRREK